MRDLGSLLCRIGLLQIVLVTFLSLSTCRGDVMDGWRIASWDVPDVIWELWRMDVDTQES